MVIEVEGGGKKRIRVADNGSGMTPAEAERALVRHATSKLRRLDDIYRLDTFGFRGEALPSIAAVSRMTLVSRAQGDELEGGEKAAVGGVKLVLRGGVLESRAEIGAAVGTQIEVRDLLFNVPARQKFLKGETTEVGHISDAVSKMALAHPDVHFRLLHGARVLFDAPPHATGLERVACVLGKRIARELVVSSEEVAGVVVTAYLASPQVSQSSARAVQLFVGRRPVRDRGLLQAVLRGYDELLSRGRYPVAAIFVEVRRPEVDVNVHPQKLEVRFADPQAVFAAVRHTVREGLRSAEWEGEGEAVPARRFSPLAETAPSVPAASSMAHSSARAAARKVFRWSRPSLAEVHFPASSASGKVGAKERSGGAERAAPPLRGRQEVAQPPAAVQGVLPVEFFSTLRYLGQLDFSYLVCEAEGELVLVDQHLAEAAAGAGVALSTKGRSPGQALLATQPLSLSTAEAATLVGLLPELSAFGFAIELEGETSARVEALPLAVAREIPERLVRDLCADLEGKAAGAERRFGVAMFLGCRAARPPGSELSPSEARALLRALPAAAEGPRCSHGQALVRRFDMAAIERVFQS